MFTQMDISLLIRLIIAHLLTDFVFQSDSWVKHRFQKGWYSEYLYIHGIIVGLFAYLFSGLWGWGLIWIPVTVAVTHILIDGIKTKYKDNIHSFLIDQFGHFMVILAIWLWIVNPIPEDLAALEHIFLSGTKIWVIITAYLIVIWPSGVLISKMVEKWKEDILKSENHNNNSLEKAGKWIGMLERFLILTFVLLQQYAAIGFLVAAKSIFRFHECRKTTEYILIGTLISFVIAIVVGLVASLFLYP